MTEELFINVTRWQQETFKNATSISKILHLKEEVDELYLDVRVQAKNRRLEFADCFMLLFGAAKADGMSYEDICNAVEEKMEICRARKWGEPDENGVVKHVK